MRSIFVVIFVIALLVPGAAWADEQRPNALEIGAAVATCVDKARGAPGDVDIVVQGSVHGVVLYFEDVSLAAIQRRPLGPSDTALPPQDSDPPLVLDPILTQETPRQHETMRYITHCFGRAVYFPEDL